VLNSLGRVTVAGRVFDTLDWLCVLCKRCTSPSRGETLEGGCVGAMSLEDDAPSCRDDAPSHKEGAPPCKEDVPSCKTGPASAKDGFLSLLTYGFQDIPIDSTDELVPTREFLRACEEFVRIFDVLGGLAFMPIKNDINGNIQVNGKNHDESVSACTPLDEMEWGGKR
jgi:hypothetical protein